MKYPIDNFSPLPYPRGSVVQYFAQNPKLYCERIKFPDGTCLIGHNGWDIVAPWGTPIYSTCDQKVVEVKTDPSGFGKHVKTISFALGLELTYGHLSEINCVLGQDLKEGQMLGKMGNTGTVISGENPFWRHNPYAGTHLHFGIRAFIPWGGLNTAYNIVYTSGDKGTILDYGNGYKGAIDPNEFFKQITPKTEEQEVTEIALTIQSLKNEVGGQSYFGVISLLLNRLVQILK